MANNTLLKDLVGIYIEDYNRDPNQVNQIDRTYYCSYFFYPLACFTYSSEGECLLNDMCLFLKELSAYKQKSQQISVFKIFRNYVEIIHVCKRQTEEMMDLKPFSCSHTFVKRGYIINNLFICSNFFSS